MLKMDTRQIITDAIQNVRQHAWNCDLRSPNVITSAREGQVTLFSQHGDSIAIVVDLRVNDAGELITKAWYAKDELPGATIPPHTLFSHMRELGRRGGGRRP